MTLLIVAGHHRSGTSLLGRVLAEAELFLGDRLMSATAANPYGHFEDLDVVRIHDRILHSHGLTWQVDRPFVPTIPTDVMDEIRDFATARQDAHRVWAFKDPRVCLFLPLWKHLVPEAKVIITVRHPAACTESLERRQVRDMLERRGDTEQGWRFWTSADHGLRLWLTYNACLRRCALAYPDDCLVTSFDQIRQGRPVVAEINRRWELGLSEIDSAALFDENVVTADRATAKGITAEDPELAERARTLWSELSDLARTDSRQGSLL
ncbi:MAG: sulfotransferase [Acidimicrobiia bacterium]|nr:sulfotransferase [Acidimicrobiia bacterium]